ncbi:peptidase inhibitor family I36 protein [Actinotalea sp. C106]|uniref:peptidase inhibitor family I36 protein n=1 Tax=Actinotalea sp. C106 TaxID=2908644 RepID=UPI0020285EC7|nr:peptidase inhibitor family I36 protein [Actinotalea sp. C106]
MKTRLGKRAAAAAALALGLAVGIGSPASAAVAPCPSGYACGWDSTSYSGTYFASALNKTNWGRQGFGNRAESAAANGASCQFTRFYKSWNIVTNDVYGDYFTLYSRQLLGSNYQDPNLSNGAGYDSAGEGSYANTLEAHWFTGC